MTLYDNMAALIIQDLPSELQDTTIPQSITLLCGEGVAQSCFPVADFSQCAIAVAVAQVQQLRSSVWGETSPARIDRPLSMAWCKRSIQPVGDWQLPGTWDEFAGDYPTRDGWIRLHTNAPHHRDSALQVLGCPKTRQQMQDAVLNWSGISLETAVVEAGGAAACFYRRDEWEQHAQGSCVNTEPVVAWRQNLQRSGGGASRAIPGVASRPLHGMRVLDLTRVLAGPVCTRFLASFGADVLRIDPPGWEEDGNALEMTLGKRCAGLDLNRAEDREVFEILLSQADVLVHGYRADALERLGYGQTKRDAMNPGLVDVALNAYGWSGPWQNRRGFDSLVQMSAGIAHEGQQWAQANHPVPLPYQALDHVTGYLMAAAAICALRLRYETGHALSARLSLARQAALLHHYRAMQEQPLPVTTMSHGIHANHAQGMAALSYCHSEDTPWGSLQRLSLPYAVDGVDVSFNHGVSRLRSAPATW